VLKFKRKFWRLKVNNLPPYIKDISNNVKKFENYLKRFLHIHSFYSLEEYFRHKFFTSWECSHFPTNCYTNVCQTCNLCSVFCVSPTINVDICIWQVPLFVTMFVNSLFVTMAVLCILLYKVSVTRLYPITLMYDLESVLIPETMYLMYTLDMFYILTLQMSCGSMER
jgi:hypothetical protein